MEQQGYGLPPCPSSYPPAKSSRHVLIEALGANLSCSRVWQSKSQTATTAGSALFWIWNLGELESLPLGLLTLHLDSRLLDFFLGHRVRLVGVSLFKTVRQLDRRDPEHRRCDCRHDHQRAEAVTHWLWHDDLQIEQQCKQQECDAT